MLAIDKSSIAHIPGAQVVQKGNFVGVVAPHECDAIQAAAQLKVKWDDDAEAAGQRQPATPRSRDPANLQSDDARR